LSENGDHTANLNSGRLCAREGDGGERFGSAQPQIRHELTRFTVDTGFYVFFAVWIADTFFFDKNRPVLTHTAPATGF
jgi:hypothetical protein